MKKLILLAFWLYLPATHFAQTRPDFVADSLQFRKLAPLVIKRKAETSFHSLRVRVKSKTGFETWVQQHKLDIRITQPSSQEEILTLSGTGISDIRKLLNCPWITFIDVPNRIAKEELVVNGSDLSTNSISAVHSQYPRFAGEGLIVSVKEKPFDTTDIDFRNRIVNLNLFDETSTIHATTMATLIAGGGNSAPSSKGVAWKSRLTTSDFKELLPDDGQQLTDAGISVQNHSYGVAIENYYGLEAEAYDKHCTQYPAIVHVFSSGNEGEQASTTGVYTGIASFANLTGQFKMSKNTLCIGATNTFSQVDARSSRGPTYDGRIKPELVAYGESGSSEAAALVSGTSLLVQQAFGEQNTGSLPPAALVKAIMINSATDVGRPEVDFETGFGQMDALGAIQTIQEKRFMTGALGQGEESIFTIQVPGNSANLKVTLVWHDPEAAPNAEQALINDLDIELWQSSSGKRWQPWVLNSYPHADSLQLPAKRQADHLNNVEQITLLSPEPGSYEFHVRGYHIVSGQQAFSLAFEYEKGFEWIYPTKQTTLKANETNLLRWQWDGSADAAQLEYRFIGSEDWKPITDEANLTQPYLEWLPPDTLAMAQLRLVTATFTAISDTFFLSRRLTLQEGYHCNDELMLHWQSLPQVSQYQLYRMGNTYIEPFLTTSDTLVVLTDLPKQGSHYAVAPVINGNAAERSPTLDYTTQGIGCFITSFLARQLVTDTVLLDLQISTLYNLQEIILEKQVNGIFQAIQTLNSVVAMKIALADSAPTFGSNLYRVRIVNNNQESFYSQTERVYYMRQGELLVYPNPISTGQLLNIIEGEDQSTLIQLYSGLGQLVYETEDAGSIKNIETRQLTRGTYWLRITTASGNSLTKQIIVF